MAPPSSLPSVGLWLVWAVVVVVGGPRPTVGFNLSPAHSKIWRGPERTHFGFSVALWLDSEGSKRVVVGAPLGRNSTVGRGMLPLGTIHLCDVTGDAICPSVTKLPIVSKTDKSEQSLDVGYSMSKYGMGFGHSLSTLKNTSSVLVACAPRYPRREKDTLENRGACFILASPENQPTALVPFSGKVVKKDSVQHAMMGFSAALDTTGDRVVLGGPNAFAGEGFLMSLPFERGIRPVNRLGGAKQLPKSVDYGESYEGWSVVHGQFGSRATIATSTVNYGNYTGRVSFYPNDMSPRRPPLGSLYGQEVGAKFGFSLGSGDVDGDGITDLIVGAPLARRGSDLAPDAGRVYVYFSPLIAGSESWPPQQLSGPDPWGRFGSAVTCLGDLNLDGYDDVAVGAPYGGPDNMGAVYIYNGGAMGLRTEPSPQVLHASYYSGGIHGFGFSLDAGLDMDDNGYPDLIVGAAESDTAVLIRASPVVSLVGNIYIRPEEVVVEDSDCQIEQAGYKTFRGVCFILTVNITYDSYREIDDLKMRFEMVLDGPEDTSLFGFTINTDPSYRRVVRVNKAGKNSPWSLRAYFKRIRSNIGQTLRATVTVSLLSPTDGEEASEVVSPVMNILGNTTFTVNTTLLCSNTQTCFSQPDLAVGASGPPVKLGEDPVVLEVSLEVQKDPGYGVEVEVNYPGIVRYHRVSGEGRIPDCNPKQLVNQIPTTVVCSFAFIEADESVNFRLQFDYDALSLLRYLTWKNSSVLFLNLAVKSDSDGDPNLENNKATVHVPVNKVAVLYTKADAEPEITAVLVNQTASSKEIELAQDKPESFTFPVDHLGPRLQQKFSLTNRRPSPILEAKLVFYLPLYHNKDRLIYLMDQPRTTGPVQCPSLPLNPLGLQPAWGVEIDAFLTSTAYHSLTTVPSTNVTDDTSSSTNDSSIYSTLEPEELLERRRREVPAGTITTMSSLYVQDDMTTVLFSPYVNPRPGRVQVVEDLPQTLECTSPECQLICDVGPLRAEESVTVIFSSYLVMATVSKLPYKSVGVRAWVEAQVDQEGSTLINPVSITTTHITVIKPPGKGLFAVPLWILLVAVGIAVLLIVLIIVVLCKVGFFKRDRPPTGAKRESLLHKPQDAGVINDVTFPDDQ